MPARTKHRGTVCALVALAAAGCAPDITKDPLVTKSAATLARFAPDSANPCQSVLPFPSDLAKDPATGLLKIPLCPADTPEQLALKTGLRTLNGYAVGVTISAPMSGAVDVASVAAGAKIIDTSTGQPVPFVARYAPDPTNLLYLQPTAPLKEGTRHFVVLTTAIKDAAGAAISPDQVFVFARSKEPLVDRFGYSAFAALPDADASALEALRAGFAPMFEALEAAGIPREQIAVAWPFTTQTVHASLPQLAALVGAAAATLAHENSSAAATHPLVAAAGIPVTQVCQIHTGRVTLPTMLTATGTFGLTDQGQPFVTSTSVDYVLTTPNLDRDPNGPARCTTAWPGDKLVVFAHGLGRCKNDALALADSFALAGFAVLSLDGPRAGARTVGTLGDGDLDGCPDQPATPEFIVLPGTGTNPFAIRDHLREWALELARVVAVAKAGAYKLAGLTTGSATPKVVLVGHSWGGMAAALAGSVAAADAVIVNAASGELGGVFQPTVRATLAAQLNAAGISTDTDPGKAMLDKLTAESVAAFRWAMEPGDPLYAAPATPAAVPALAQIVTGTAPATDAPLHAGDTQEKLTAAFGRATVAQTKFAFAIDATTPLCDSPSGVVGALLKPCIADSTKATYPAALAKTAALRRQAVTFAATALAGTPVVCSTDYTVACP